MECTKPTMIHLCQPTIYFRVRHMKLLKNKTDQKVTLT